MTQLNDDIESYAIQKDDREIYKQKFVKTSILNAKNSIGIREDHVPNFIKASIKIIKAPVVAGPYDVNARNSRNGS